MAIERTPADRARFAADMARIRPLWIIRIHAGRRRTTLVHRDGSPITFTTRAEAERTSRLCAALTDQIEPDRVFTFRAATLPRRPR